MGKSKLKITMKKKIIISKQGGKCYYYRRSIKGLGRVNFPLKESMRESENIARKIEVELVSGVDPMLVLKKYHPGHSIFVKSRVRRLGGVGRRSLEGTVPLVGDILDLHELLEERLEIASSTARRNRQALIRLIIVALGISSSRQERMKIGEKELKKVRMLPGAIINDMLLAEYRFSYTEGFQGVELQTRKRAANSTINQALSVFSVRACKYYRSEGVDLPDLAEVKIGNKFGRTGRTKLIVPDGRIVRSVFDLWQTWVQRVKDGDTSIRNVTVALTLILFVGLRRSEAARVRRSHLRFEPPGLDVAHSRDEVTKSGDEYPIPIEPFVFRFLDSVGQDRDGFLIRGNRNTRADRVFREVAQALRSTGITSRRPNHFMRKLYASWVTQTIGLAEAQYRLGHESAELTFKTYAKVKMPKELLDLWTHDPFVSESPDSQESGESG